MWACPLIVAQMHSAFRVACGLQHPRQGWWQVTSALCTSAVGTQTPSVPCVKQSSRGGLRPVFHNASGPSDVLSSH